MGSGYCEPVSHHGSPERTPSPPPAYSRSPETSPPSPPEYSAAPETTPTLSNEEYEALMNGYF